MHEGNLRGEERILAHEGLGAVDRIDEPEIFRFDRALSGFLAVETVRRKPLGNDAADHALALGHPPASQATCLP